MPSAVQPLIDALEFIKFTDRAIGNRFKDALNALDEDMTDEEYEPSPKAEDIYKKLAEEIEDAQENQSEAEDRKEPEIPVIKESELPEPDEEKELPVIKLDDADEDET